MSCHLGIGNPRLCLGNLIVVIDELFNYNSMSRVKILVRISQVSNL